MERRTSTVRTVKSQRHTNSMRPRCYRKGLSKFSLNTIENFRELTINWSLPMKMNNKFLMMLMLLNLLKSNPLDNAKLMSDSIPEILWITFNLNVLKTLKKR